MTGVTVVVDFGSSHTVAVRRVPGRPAEVTGEPSVVLLNPRDQVVAGSEALRLSVADSSRALTRLKSRLDEREVLVGDTVLPVVGLVRALFSRLVRTVEEPVDELVLTHPADWPSERVAVLTRAASGFATRVLTVPSPVAAAAGAELESGATLLVVDFGAATCTAAAVRRTSAGYAVLSHGCLDLGGDDLDARVRDHLGTSLGVAQEAKEQVVRTGTAEGLDSAELERLVADDVGRVVALVERVVAETPVDRVLLVGGSSRLPLVGRRVAEAVARPVRLAMDPETAVAWGALLAVDGPPPAEAPAAADTTAAPAAAVSGAASGVGSAVGPGTGSAGFADGPAATPAVGLGTGSAAAPGAGSGTGTGSTGAPAGSAAGSAAGPDDERAAVATRPRSFLRGAVVALAALVLVVAAAAVAVVGIGPGQLTAGLPGPADQPPAADQPPELPPEVAGSEMVGRGQPSFTLGRFGTPVRYRYPSGTTLELVLTGVQAQRSAPPPVEDAPLGYRWVTVVLSGTNVAGPAWRQEIAREVAALDDRGQWIRPLGTGVVPCDLGAAPPPTVRPGASFDACVVIPVPEATPVGAVAFGAPGGSSPPVRFPVSVPAASETPAPARVVGRLGEPAVEVRVDGDVVRAGADVVLTPSGYLPDRRPAAGNRFVVVRAQLPATGTADHVYLRDDRGVLTRPLTGFDTMPNCPPFVGPGESDQLVYACFVYELDADTPIAGVTLGSPLTGTGREIERWPTWLAE